MEPAAAVDPSPTLIAESRRGDPEAFGTLVRHYQTPVYNLVYRMLGTAQEAEDGAQETFLRAYSQLASYNPESRFTPWLMSIATHYCIDRLRRRKFLSFSLDEPPAQEVLPDKAPGPEETALRHERMEEVQRLLGKLSPSNRAVVVLKYWSDLPVQEIAQITGDSVSSVKVKLHRARQTLARELEGRQRASASVGLEGVSGHAR